MGRVREKSVRLSLNVRENIKEGKDLFAFPLWIRTTTVNLLREQKLQEKRSQLNIVENTVMAPWVE